MLPGFRILAAMVVFGVGLLVFGLGAASLLRTAQLRTTENYAAWRAPAEVFGPATDRPPMLALLRVDPPVPLPAPAPPDMPPVDLAPPISPAPIAAAETIEAPSESQAMLAALEDATLNPADIGSPPVHADAAAAAATAALGKPADRPAAPVEAASLPSVDPAPPSGEAAAPPQLAVKVVASAPPVEPVVAGEVELIGPVGPPPPLPIPHPLRLAALSDTSDLGAEEQPTDKAAEAAALKQQQLRDLRARQRAQARRAKRLAAARARAAQLAQSNQQTSFGTPTATTNGTAALYNQPFPTTTTSTAPH